MLFILVVLPLAFALFAVLPAFRNIYDNISFEYAGLPMTPIDRVYNSQAEQAMSLAEVGAFLELPGVLPQDVRQRLRLDD